MSRMLSCANYTSMELIKISFEPGSVTEACQPGWEGGSPRAQAIPRAGSLGGGQRAPGRTCGPRAAEPSYFPREAGTVRLPSFQC